MMRGLNDVACTPIVSQDEASAALDSGSPKCAPALLIDDIGTALALMAAPIGRQRMADMMLAAGSASALFEAIVSGDEAEFGRECGSSGIERDPQTVARGLGACRRYLRSCDTGALERALERIGGMVLGLCDQLYPPLLAELERPPPVIAVAGDAALLSRCSVAIVGTRKATITGVRVAERIGAELADAGIGVVSGLAKGIDAAAHRGALRANGCAAGRPIGVLGCGLDVIYPKANAELFGAVIERGALVSQFGLGVSPERWRFPVRNRTIAGLSLGVVVVEAGRTGGALSTAAAAREENRDVMVVPGSVENPSATGVIDLLKDGAAPIASGIDVTAVVSGFKAPGFDPESPAKSAIFAEGSLEFEILTLMGDRVERSVFDIADAAGVTVRYALGALDRLTRACAIERAGEGSFILASGFQ